MSVRSLSRPVALVIAVTGALLGVPLGRMLHERVWRGKAVAAPMLTVQKPEPALPDIKPPQPPAAVAAVVANGLLPAEAEARRVAQALLARYQEWQKQEGERAEWTPLALVQEALALGAREDAALIVQQMLGRPYGCLLADLVLCGWADRDPKAAWDFVAAKMIDPRPSGSRFRGMDLVRFARRMAHFHWALIEPLLKYPADGDLAYLAAESWTQRLSDAPNGAEAFNRLREAPDGRVRDLVRSHLYWQLGPRYPEECIAFLAEVPEAHRLNAAGILAKSIAKSHPALALKMVQDYPFNVSYSWAGDDYSDAEDTLEATMRRAPAQSLVVLAQLLREHRQMGHSGFADKMQAMLPRRMEDWLPAAVEAAKGWSQGGEFLADLVGGCPWNEGVDGAKAVAAIGDPFHEKVVKLNIEIYFDNFIFGAGLGLVSHWPEVH